LAEAPVVTLARILGGVVLLQGRLGHQMLGQLLLANSDDLAIAGASVVVAAASRSPNAVLRTVLQTAAPAAALHSLFARRQEQLRLQEARLRKLEARLRDERRALDTRPVRRPAPRRRGGAPPTGARG
jgi:hypothetical protein